METVAVSLNNPTFCPDNTSLMRTRKFSRTSTEPSLMSVILTAASVLTSMIVRSSFTGEKSMPAIERC